MPCRGSDISLPAWPPCQLLCRRSQSLFATGELGSVMGSIHRVEGYLVYVNIIIHSHSEICLWGEADSLFFCCGGNVDGEAVNCETMADEDVISQSVYLSGLVIAYNPSGCLNKGSLLFSFLRDWMHYLKRHYLLW